MPTNISIIGAGGHCKVVIDALLSSNSQYEISVYDSDPQKIGTTILGIPITQLQDFKMLDAEVFVAIGDNESRAKITGEVLESGKIIATIIHKDAVAASSSTIGSGTFVAALAVVSASATVGNGAIINHRAIVDHDCSIGNFSHIAPQVTLGGGVQIGSQVLVGAGATVLPMKSIGQNATIGAGAVVTADVIAGVTVVGNPAKEL